MWLCKEPLELYLKKIHTLILPATEDGDGKMK